MNTTGLVKVCGVASSEAWKWFVYEKSDTDHVSVTQHKFV